MVKYCIKTNDNNYYCIQAKNALETIVLFFRYNCAKNETIEKALLRMDNIEEAILLYNSVCGDYDYQIETVFEIGETQYGRIPFCDCSI